MSLPPPLPPQGFLLEPFGFLTEPLAAIAIDLQPATLIEYRKAGIGPDYAIVGRTVLYSRDNLKKWLEAGGTKASSGSVLVFPADRRTWGAYGLFPAQFKSVPLATNGTFELTGLPAGDYCLVAGESSQSQLWQDAQWLERAAGAAMRVTLAWGGAETLDLTKVVVR